jgi:radical SAM protein with 4Fe4S-binding SPASM domain
MKRSPIRLARAAQNLAQRELDFYRYRPSSASLELTQVCNLRCVMCDFGRHRYTNKGELSIGEWCTVIDGLIHLGVRWMNFIGAEPLVRKNDVLEMAEYLQRRGVHRQLNTNGTMINPDLAAHIVDRFETVIISLDAPRERHNQIRGQAWAFERAAEGIRLILDARRAQGKTTPQMTIHTTLLNVNYDVVSDMIREAENLGADAISFQYVSETTQDSVRRTVLDGQVIASDRYTVSEGDSLLFNPEQARAFREQLQQAQHVSHSIQIMFGLLPYLSDDALVSGKFPVNRCYFTRNKLAISPQGEVHICSHLDYSIGNVRQAPVEQLWGNEKHRRLTEQLSRELMPVCRSCCHFAANLTPTQYLQLARGQMLS